MMKLNPQDRGFSIIEVLVAILVLALGILAVVKLQGVLIQSASDSTQRAFAVSLAQEKIDDLRSFSDSFGFRAIETDGGGETDPDGQTILAATLDCADPMPDWASIVDSETENPPEVSPVSIPRQNYSYGLCWNVVDYYHTTPNAPPETGTPGIDPIAVGATPDLKVVNVFVAWQDETGAPQQVAVETIIDSYPPGLTSASAQPSPGGIPPRASYTPEGAPDVIDIAVDTDTERGTKRQTSKPLPEVVRTGGDQNTIVSFDVMTYEPRGGSTGDFVATRQEEFVTVDCACELSAEPGPAMTPAHAVWDEVSQTRFDVMGQWDTKQTAVMVASENANDAEEFCTVCCRDHHDAVDALSPVKYVPDTAGGNHTHFKADGSGPAAAGDLYTESCRLKRVDGILRVYQDWNLLDITILDRLQLFGTQLQGQYETYVTDLILSNFDDSVTEVKASIDRRVETTVGVQQQLESRGVYLDTVYDLEGNVSTEYEDYIADSANSDRLEKVPFAEVNLTLLSIWESLNPGQVSVASEPVATIPDPDNNYYGVYRRGWISALGETEPGPDAFIETTMRANNDGLTQLDIDPNVLEMTDTIPVAVGPEAIGGAPLNISGAYDIHYPLGNTNAKTEIIWTPEASGSCSLSGSPGNTYECSFATPWTGSIQIRTKVTSGPQNQRCSGESATYVGTSLGEGTQTRDFALFLCD